MAGRDLMVLDVDKELTISNAEAFEGGWIPPSSV